MNRATDAFWRAGAYCLQNELKDRDVFVEQAQLKDSLREDQILRLALKPGQKHCCRNLSCNPGGRSESTVELYVTVLGEPEYQCAPEKVQTVKVTGDGLLRIQRNPYKSQLSPYIVRIRSLPSRAEADALAGQLRGRYGVTDPKVGS